MAEIYEVGGEGFHPVADATIETDREMNFKYENGTFVIAFYDGAGNPVSPLAGTIVAESSPIEGQWLAPSSGDAVIDASTVHTVHATYKMPAFGGPVRRGRITIAGIAGAVQFKAYFWRF